MFMLLMYAGDYAFAIDCKYVKEIVPQVHITKTPHVSDHLLGHINYSGRPIPVADLTMLIEKRPSSRNMNTRIVLIQPPGARNALFGLIAERVTEAKELDLDGRMESSIHPKDLPFLASILNKDAESIQLLDVEKLFAFLSD